MRLFARGGRQLLGVDLSAEKVRMIEADIGEIIEKTVRAGRLAATTYPEEAVLNTDVPVISDKSPERVL